MRYRPRAFVVLASLVGLVALSWPAVASHEARPRTNNLHPMGHIEEPRALLGGVDGTANTNIHTDIAFWGDLAFQGNWDGFTIRDISAPGNPRTVSHTSCDGNQGDLVVWDTILVRSWNAPAGSGLPFGTGTTCAGQPVPTGWEGVHIFDISDPSAPTLIGAVQLRCGSHTATGVPDPANNRLLVYSSASSSACLGFDLIEIPLSNPAAARHVEEVEGETMCHDTGVILGDVMKAACAGHHGFQVYDISDPFDPKLTMVVDVNEAFGYQPTDRGFISIGHSAVFTWDGRVIVFGHEPGGGVQARCKDSDVATDKSAMFFDAATGEFLGMWTLPRAQSRNENCTIHNYNVVPTRTGRYILVSGNYQAGTWVTDFTDPANPRTLAWSDPAPEPFVPTTPFCRADGDGCEIGGVWSTYWYNGFIYETHITSGLNVFRFSGPETAGAIRLGHLNPQTQGFSLP